MSSRGMSSRLLVGPLAIQVWRVKRSVPRRTRPPVCFLESPLSGAFYLREVWCLGLVPSVECGGIRERKGLERVFFKGWVHCAFSLIFFGGVEEGKEFGNQGNEVADNFSWNSVRSKC